MEKKYAVLYPIYIQSMHLQLIDVCMHLQSIDVHIVKNIFSYLESMDLDIQLGDYYQSLDEEQSTKYYLSCARKGNSYAKYKMGIYYQNKKDYDHAIRYFE